MGFILDPTGILGGKLTKSTDNTDINSIFSTAESNAKNGLYQFQPPNMSYQHTMNALAGQSTDFTQTDLVNALLSNSTGWRTYQQAPHTPPTKWGI